MDEILNEIKNKEILKRIIPKYQIRKDLNGSDMFWNYCVINPRILTTQGNDLEFVLLLPTNTGYSLKSLPRLAISLDCISLNLRNDIADLLSKQKKYNVIEYIKGIFYIEEIDENNVIHNIELLKEIMFYISKLPICENTYYQNLQEYDKFPFFY